jgi:histone deacetylase 1/2
MMAQHQPPTQNKAQLGATAWDPSSLYAALHHAGVATHHPSSADWYFDTDASTHMSSGSGIYPSSFHPFHSFVTVGNGARLPVTHTAAATIPTPSVPLRLNNILVTPSLVKNIVSARQLTPDNNISIEFDPNGFSIKDLPTQTVTLRCDSSGDLYPLRLPRHQALSASSPASIELWHNRLGHPESTTLSQLLQSLDFHCNKTTTHSCHHCRVGKHTRLHFQHSDTPAYFPFQLVHSDLWTSPVYSHSGYKYYVVFIDAYTHYIWTYPVRNKSDVPAVIRTFFAYVHTQFRLPIVAFQSDNGTEYGNIAMRSFFSAHDTAFRLSCPYTSQQNGKAERILRTINDCICTLLLHSASPLSFWVEALNIATYVINRRQGRATGPVTPHQLLLGVPPHYDELRVFGCLCYPNTSTTTTHKFSPPSVACAFLGYPSDHRGYKCYDLATGRVYTSRHVTFMEHVFPFRDRAAAASSSPAPATHDDDDTPGPPACVRQQQLPCPPASPFTPQQLPRTPASPITSPPLAPHTSPPLLPMRTPSPTPHHTTPPSDASPSATTPTSGVQPSPVYATTPAFDVTPASP